VREHAAQELVAGELAALGFDVSWLEIPAETAACAPGGVAQAPYHGRRNVLGTANGTLAAHADAHGIQPRRMVLGTTTDARFYLNQFGRPAVAYGPKARNIHAPDEAVEVASIVQGPRTLARFIAGFFAAGGLPGDGHPGGRTPVIRLPGREADS
jgi:Peptidase family M20/M25/M40